MRAVASLRANNDWTLDVAFASGEMRRFDLKPWLADEAFEDLDLAAFKRVRNCGYFVEWENGADLSADTLYHRGTPLPEGVAERPTR
jgi:hypothetical protein